jgi:hypothetical protein
MDFGMARGRNFRGLFFTNQRMVAGMKKAMMKSLIMASGPMTE